MSTRISPTTYTWLAEHQATLESRFGAKDDESVANLLDRLAGRASSKVLYQLLAQSLTELSAPDNVKKELNSFITDVEAYWSSIPAHDEAGILNTVRAFRDAKSARNISDHIMREVSDHTLSHKTASDLIHGAYTFYGAERASSSMPWYCFVCYSVPILGLVCLLKKACRGKSAGASVMETIQ